MRNLSHQAYLNAYMDYDAVSWQQAVAGASSRFAADDGSLEAFFARSPWDETVLGIPVAKVHSLFGSEPEARSVASFARGLDDAIKGSGSRFATARMDFGLFPLLGALEENGWRVADVLNIYHLPAGAAPGPGNEGLHEPGWEEVEAGFPDPAAYFAHSRIARDRGIPRAAVSRFFRELLRHTFVAPGAVKLGLYRNGTLAGIAVGGLDEGPAALVPGGLGFLWLIAVRPEWAGKGLSKPLLAGFLSAMAARAGHIEIGTQVDNLAANRLYQGMGLKPAACAITLHRWYGTGSV